MIKLLKPIAHCYGVINAIELAKKVANENKGKNIYVFGLLVHNEEVTKELDNYGIKTIDLTELDPIEGIYSVSEELSLYKHNYCFFENNPLQLFC